MKNKDELILKIISKALNIPRKNITEKTNLTVLEEWDSLGMLAVMSAIDKKFKIKIDINSFEKAETVKDIIKII